MGDTSIITQVQREECQHLNSNGNHVPVLNEKGKSLWKFLLIISENKGKEWN